MYEQEEYELLSQNFKENYTTEQLLSICERYKLSLFGNREILIERLAYYFSEGQHKDNIYYRLKECCNKIILRYNNYYSSL